MFSFVVRWLGFFKAIPLAAHFFDAILKLDALVRQPELLEWLDDLEAEVFRWNGTTITLHKYGGLQFNYQGKEFGHLHSNGLLDILFSQDTRKTLLTEGRIQAHHLFPESGWISFYIRSKDDVSYAKRLMFMSYIKRTAKNIH